MTGTQSENIKKVFNLYRNSIFSIQNDIQFWEHFLQWAITKYPEWNPAQREAIFSSIFHVYDCSFNSQNGYLKSYHRSFNIFFDDLEKFKISFFDWMLNLSLLGSS